MTKDSARPFDLQKVTFQGYNAMRFYLILPQEQRLFSLWISPSLFKLNKFSPTFEVCNFPFCKSWTSFLSMQIYFEIKTKLLTLKFLWLICNSIWQSLVEILKVVTSVFLQNYFSNQKMKSIFVDFLTPHP